MASTTAVTVLASAARTRPDRVKAELVAILKLHDAIGPQILENIMKIVRGRYNGAKYAAEVAREKGLAMTAEEKAEAAIKKMGAKVNGTPTPPPAASSAVPEPIAKSAKG